MSHICCLALNTFRELVRSKVLYAVFLFAAALVFVASLFGAVTIGDQILVIKDFGLFSISISSVVFAVIAGASLLSKELSRKTIYNVLSKPVHRYEFIVGKFLGILAAVTLLLSLMGISLVAYVSVFQGRLDWSLGIAFFGIVLEMVILCAAALFFSSIVVTPVLSGLFTCGVFLAGRSVEYLLYFIQEQLVEGLYAQMLKGLYAVLPHLSALNLSASVVFGAERLPTRQHLMNLTAYSIGYAATLLVLATIFFRKREFN